MVWTTWIVRRGLATTAVAQRRGQSSRSALHARHLLLQQVEARLQQQQQDHPHQQQEHPQHRWSFEMEESTQGRSVSRLARTWAGRVGVSELAFWLERLQETRCQLPIEVYNVCLAACGTRVDLAELWFHTLRTQKLQPEAETYRAMVSLYASTDAGEAGRWLHRFVADPNVCATRRDFLLVIQSHARSGNPAEVDAWRLALALRDRPLGAEAQDRDTVLSVLAMQAARGYPLDCVLWHGILLRLLTGRQGGQRRHGTRQVSWNLVLRAFVQAADLGGARAWLAEMKTVNAVPAPRVLQDVALLSQAHGPTIALDIPSARKLMADVPAGHGMDAEWIRALTIQSTTQAVTDVHARISVLLRTGDVASALVAFRALLASNDSEASHSTAEDAVEVVVRQLSAAARDDVDTAKQLLEVLLAQTSVRRDLLADAAYEQLTDSTQRDLGPALSARLMHVYARRKTPRKAVHVMRQLMLSGQRPNRDVFNGLLAAYAAVARPEVALATLQRMQNDGFAPDAQSYGSIVQAYRGAGKDKVAEEWRVLMDQATAADQASKPLP